MSRQRHLIRFCSELWRYFEGVHCRMIFLGILCLFLLEPCLAGNVALGKPASQTGSWQDMTADKAVDGLLYDTSPNHCAAPEIPVGRPAEWSVDLQNLYLISSVTVYNTGDMLDYKRLNNFTVEVLSDEQQPIICGQFQRTVGRGAHVTVTCPPNTVGDKVKILREGDGPSPHFVPLCEVQVNALQYNGCRIGYYGAGCTEKCGNCLMTHLAYNACDRMTGHCIQGCQVGWTETRCHSKLEDVNRQSVLIPWVLFAISCLVILTLGACLIHNKLYTSSPSPDNNTSRTRQRSILSPRPGSSGNYRDINLELEPSLLSRRSEGCQPYDRLNEDYDSSMRNPYDVIL